jgi:hypothetical protein
LTIKRWINIERSTTTKESKVTKKPESESGKKEKKG